MATVYTANLLEGTGDLCCQFTAARAIGLCIKSALTGALTLVGVTNPDGTPATWIVPAGTSGFVPAPGSTWTSNRLFFTLPNPADSGKAILILKSN